MKAVRRGFIKSIPILCSYLFVGMAYGITMQNAGFFGMMRLFEGNLEDNVVISHTRSTKELMNAYESVTDLSTEEFLWWMGGRADWFKGYSQTALNYVIRYRDSILSWVREEEKKGCGNFWVR